MKPLALAAPGAKAVLLGDNVSELGELLIERCGLSADRLHRSIRDAQATGAGVILTVTDDPNELPPWPIAHRPMFTMGGSGVIRDLMRVLEEGIENGPADLTIRYVADHIGAKFVAGDGAGDLVLTYNTAGDDSPLAVHTLPEGIGAMTVAGLDGEQVLVAASIRDFSALNPRNGDLVRQLRHGQSTPQYARTFGQTVCLFSGSDGVHTWDLHDDHYTTSAPTSVVPHTDLPSYAPDHLVRLRDQASGTVHSFGGRSAVCVVPRRGGNLITAVPEQSRVQLTSSSTVEQVRTIDAHTTRITAVASVPMPDGDDLVATASAGGTIRVWDPATGMQVRVFVPSGAPTAMAGYIAPNGSPRLASADETGLVQIWDLDMAPDRSPGPVLTRGFADRVSTRDLLDRERLVATLAEALRPAEADDDDTGPTVTTIEGPWGSGKSTVLDLVHRRLRSEPQKEKKHHRLTVRAADRLLRKGTEEPVRADLPPATVPRVATFNPWRHQSSEQVWAGLARSIVDVADQTILRDPDRREHYWFTRNVARIDRRHTQRELWKRIRSPWLSVGVLGLGLSLVAQLTKVALPWPWVGAGLFLLGGLAHTAKRYLSDRASAFLPAELFAGPVQSTAFATGRTGGDVSIRDPFYQAKSGYLYLVQHDVKAVLRSLAEERIQVVVLVDDLDRCTPRTTAEVFEAINVFLADDFPRTRFVLGLDPVVVAAHVDRAYKELADADIVKHPDDPSPGWTFLRKLVQLPVRLPTTTDENVERVLEAHLGPVHREEETPAQPQPAAPAPVEAPRVTDTKPVVAPARTPARAEAVVIAIERDPRVRDHLHRRLIAQQEHSVREEKRLITVWQFYLRVLGSADVEQACHLVAVAEIVTRWPAYQHLLRRNWQQLADAVDDDVGWGATIAQIGFKRADEKAAKNLRALLSDCDAQAVAKLADRLL